MMLGLRGSTAMVGSTRWRSEKVSPAMSMFRSTIIAAWTVEVDTAKVTKTRANAVSSLNSLRLTLQVGRYKQDAFWTGKRVPQGPCRIRRKRVYEDSLETEVAFQPR